MKVVLLACLTVFLATCSQPPGLLEEIRAAGELRVVTRISPTTYYNGPNGPLGPEYELAKGFADFLGVTLKIVPVDHFAELIPLIESGSAHLAAAGLTVTDARAKRVEFGPSYQQVSQSLIYKRRKAKPRRPADLIGKRIEVGVGTSYVERLARLQAEEPRLVFSENPNADVAELILAVARGDIDYTVADSHLLRIYRNLAPEIREGFELSAGDSLAWAMPRRRDHSLAEQVDAYFEKIRSNGQLSRIMDRYYGHTGRFDYVGTHRFLRDARNKLPLYRELFENAANATGTDWRLLAAIGYQESRWNPDAVSPTGVRGIMMLTQRTADVIGVDDRIDPAQSIVGGADYLNRMKRRLPPDITDPDRTWFALAAYNVGFGHVRDARRLAAADGQDSRLWVHVRPYFEKLTQRRWYRQAKHGYAPGWEPVMYVENVRNYYDILRWLDWKQEQEKRRHSPAATIVEASSQPPPADTVLRSVPTRTEELLQKIATF